MIRQPNFLVIGAQKAGTTYLCAALARHSDVFHSEPKEPLFFQKAHVNAESFGNYLQTYFSGARDELRIGEGSTVYFQWPNALKNIRACLGDEIKVIISLRHPTDRAVSFYLHNLKKGRLTGTERICDTGTDVRSSPMLSSMYASHLERWLEAFGEQVKILRFDDLLAEPIRFVEQATSFLGLSVPKAINEAAVNKGFGLAWRDDRLTLDTTGPPNQRTPSFSMSELEDLHALFIDDIEKTEALLGVSLVAWKQMPDFTAKQSGW